ncbi:MAG: hypothetical protein HOO89_04650 [Ferruginibacter sp.]|nr:hypothetical protein [Ferruginibacter sp.]
MKKTTLLFLSSLIVNLVTAQYYYKDIVSNNQVHADMNTYKENKIKSITIKSFEDNGMESDGFICEKKINKKYSKTELFTGANSKATALFTSYFNKQGKLTSTNDSSEISVTKINYNYDTNGKVLSIFSSISSSDDDFENKITEEHIYIYSNEVITKMLKIKNNKDTTTILFSLDEKGNIAVEKDTKNATKYYYYYDAQNRLTDIVQANEYNKNLKPEYIFEYNNAGQITQMTSVEEGSSNYFVWKYSYANGLRTKERCFTNEKRLMGSIEYEYK